MSDGPLSETSVKCLSLRSGEETNTVFLVENDTCLSFSNYISGLFGNRTPSFIIVRDKRLPPNPPVLWNHVEENSEYEVHFLEERKALFKTIKELREESEPVDDTHASATDQALRLLREIQEAANKSQDPVTVDDAEFLIKVMSDSDASQAMPVALMDKEEEAAQPVTDWLKSNFGRQGSLEGRRASAPKVQAESPPKRTVINEKDDKYPVQLPEDKVDEVEKILNSIPDWDGYDVFRLAELTENRPLQFTTWRALQHFNLFETLDLDPTTVRAFLKEIETRYQPTNPYHNNCHAADIVQCCVFFLGTGKLSEHMNTLQILAMLIAAASHDVEHNGVNNAYHVNTQSPLALRHNDRAVLESHHSSVLFQVLKKPETNILKGMDSQQLRSFREVALAEILGTDMSQHFSHVAHFKSLVDKPLDTWEDKDRVCLQQFSLHSADISNACRPLRTAKIWTDRCLFEFFAQGDKERAQDLKISPLCDRTATPVAQSQIGFIKFIVMPTYTLLASLLPELKVCLDNLSSNLAFWEEVQAGTRDLLEAGGCASDMFEQPRPLQSFSTGTDAKQRNSLTNLDAIKEP